MTKTQAGCKAYSLEMVSSDEKENISVQPHYQAEDVLSEQTFGSAQWNEASKGGLLSEDSPLQEEDHYPGTNAIIGRIPKATEVPLHAHIWKEQHELMCRGLSAPVPTGDCDDDGSTSNSRPTFSRLWRWRTFSFERSDKAQGHLSKTGTRRSLFSLTRGGSRRGTLMESKTHGADAAAAKGACSSHSSLRAGMDMICSDGSQTLRARMGDSATSDVSQTDVSLGAPSTADSKCGVASPLSAMESAADGLPGESRSVDGPGASLGASDKNVMWKQTPRCDASRLQRTETVAHSFVSTREKVLVLPLEILIGVLILLETAVQFAGDRFGLGIAPHLCDAGKELRALLGDAAAKMARKCKNFEHYTPGMAVVSVVTSAFGSTHGLALQMKGLERFFAEAAQVYDFAGVNNVHSARAEMTEKQLRTREAARHFFEAARNLSEGKEAPVTGSATSDATTFLKPKLRGRLAGALSWLSEVALSDSPQRAANARRGSDGSVVAEETEGEDVRRAAAASSGWAGLPFSQNAMCTPLRLQGIRLVRTVLTLVGRLVQRVFRCSCALFLSTLTWTRGRFLDWLKQVMGTAKNRVATEEGSRISAAPPANTSLFFSELLREQKGGVRTWLMNAVSHPEFPTKRRRICFPPAMRFIFSTFHEVIRMGRNFQKAYFESFLYSSTTIDA